MMSLIDRMADAQFDVTAPLCEICKNELTHKFDNTHPEKPIMSCRELGEIPKPIYQAKVYTCPAFVLDDEKYKMNKSIIPKDFIPR